MVITLTGSKYSSSVSTVGSSTRLISSAASFTSSDFGAQRIIGLWNSTGTYKGVAWVRRWISATELELEQPFIDKNGSAVTQVVGDNSKVSVDYPDVVQTGIAVSGQSVTITDTIVFGTSGVGNSLCFYSEDKLISANVSAGLVFNFAGGLTVLGHLRNFATRSVSNVCSIVIASTGEGGAGDQIKTTSLAAKVWWMGGNIFSQTSPSRLIGNRTQNTTATPAEWQKYWSISTNCDVLAPNDASGWSSNAANQEVADIFVASSGQYSIALRWADGKIIGGNYLLTGSISLSVFNHAAGTWAIGAPAGQFTYVFDCGYGSQSAFHSGDSGQVAKTINCTNIVTPNRKFGTGLTPGSTPNNSATGNFYFSGLYTNLLNGTLALVKNNNLISGVQDSYTLNAGGSVTLTVLEATVAGFTETVRESAWMFGFYLYGYNISTGTFATTTIGLNAGQTGKIVVFGGFVGQIADVNISQAVAATVAAYTSLINFDQLYDYTQYYKTLATSTAIYPTATSQLISSASGALFTPVAHSLTIDSSAASVFAISANTITIKPLTDIASGIKSDTFNLSPGKTLTFVQGGDKSGAIYSIPATGIVLVPPVPVNLTKSIFASGSTINRIGATGTAIVTVDASQVANITAGTGVIVQSVQATLTVTTTIGASVSIRAASNNALIASGTADGSGNFTAAYSGSGVSAILRVRKAGFVPIQNAVAITAAGLNASAVLSADGNYNPTY